jgi:glucose-1-phosphate thymidylyltransferase
VGPNVSLEQGTSVRDSTLANAIVGQHCRLSGVQLDGAMLGNHVVAEGIRGSASLGDHSEVTART